MTASLFGTAASSSPRATEWLPCLSSSSDKSVTPSWRASDSVLAAISRYKEKLLHSVQHIHVTRYRKEGLLISDINL